GRRVAGPDLSRRLPRTATSPGGLARSGAASQPAPSTRREIRKPLAPPGTRRDVPAPPPSSSSPAPALDVGGVPVSAGRHAPPRRPSGPWPRDPSRFSPSAGSHGPIRPGG